MKTKNKKFEENKEFSEKCRPLSDKYYKNEHDFSRFLRDHTSINRNRKVIDVKRFDDYSFQAVANKDVQLTFEGGNSIAFDEKNDKEHRKTGNVFLECINDKRKYSWATKEGNYIIYNLVETNELGDPIKIKESFVFQVTKDFKNTFNLKSNYPKDKEGKGIIVPIEDFRKYLNGNLKKGNKIDKWM
jgi:hypothetical protein